MRRFVLAVFLGGCPACASVPELPPPPPPEPEAAPAPAGPDEQRFETSRALLERIGVIGASSSAGYGNGVALAEVLHEALSVEHRTFDVSSSAHFLRPLEIGKTEALAVALRRPTIVFAVDFLFWYAYGDKSDELRDAHLEVAFGLLEGLGVPVIVGDLPDVHGASRQMIAPKQIPDATVIAELNGKIEAWAAEHDAIELVPLSRWHARMREGAAVTVFDTTVQRPFGDVMQWDKLHPSPRGQALLALMLLQELERRFGPLAPDDLVRDPQAFMDAFGEANDLPPPPS